MALHRPPKKLSPEQSRDPGGVRLAALRLLARRDFGSAELRKKLSLQGFDAVAAEEVVAELGREGALDDARYAQNYVTYHAARGQGPLRIGADLRRLGVGQPVAEAALSTAADWPALAAKVRRAKFGAKSPDSWAEKARQARFLQYRGFSSDHIRAATGADSELD
jgi:regulatory protein